MHNTQPRSETAYLKLSSNVDVLPAIAASACTSLPPPVDEMDVEDELVEADETLVNRFGAAVEKHYYVFEELCCLLDEVYFLKLLVTILAIRLYRSTTCIVFASV